MPSTFRATSWDDIQELRRVLSDGLATATSLEAAAQMFASGLAGAFESVLLSRLFVVVPASTLPDAERRWAEDFARTAQRKLAHATPVLTLMGTAGVLPEWNGRQSSAGHRAIPLLDKELVEGAPMIAELLASLRVELVGLRGDAPAQLRSLPGGLNARFFVPDARTTVDSRGRFVIAARDFVERHGVVSVFGMGGSYVGGELAVAVVFTRELLDTAIVDRFPSFIGTFKMATARLLAEGKLFR